MATSARTLPTTPQERETLAIIDRARARAGWSQTALADAAGVSQSQMSKLLRGERAVTITELFRMCAALDLMLSDVLRQAGL